MEPREKQQYLGTFLFLVIIGVLCDSPEYLPRHVKPDDPLLFLGKFVHTCAPSHLRAEPTCLAYQRLETRDAPALVRMQVEDLTSGGRLYTG